MSVERPEHYKGNGKIECIDYIKDKLTKEQYSGFCLGNVFKYLSRYKQKGGLNDLTKARQYLEWMIEEEVQIPAKDAVIPPLYNPFDINKQIPSFTFDELRRQINVEKAKQADMELKEKIKEKYAMDDNFNLIKKAGTEIEKAMRESNVLDSCKAEISKLAVDEIRPEKFVGNEKYSRENYSNQNEYEETLKNAKEKRENELLNVLSSELFGHGIDSEKAREIAKDMVSAGFM